LTVSHRVSLWKYHKYILQFDGRGNARFSTFDPEERLALQEEKTKLEFKINNAPKLQDRIVQLEKLLMQSKNKL
jgi:ATP-binding cassette subfamily D (ALD) long-chain fatty acid import protein